MTARRRVPSLTRVRLTPNQACCAAVAYAAGVTAGVTAVTAADTAAVAALVAVAAGGALAPGRGGGIQRKVATPLGLRGVCAPRSWLG